MVVVVSAAKKKLTAAIPLPPLLRHSSFLPCSLASCSPSFYVLSSLFRSFLPLVVHTTTALAAVTGTRTTTGRAIRTATTIATARIGTMGSFFLCFLLLLLLLPLLLPLLRPLLDLFFFFCSECRTNCSTQLFFLSNPGALRKLVFLFTLFLTIAVASIDF